MPCCGCCPLLPFRRYASNVYKALCKHSGETVCLKSYSLGSLCDLNRFQVRRSERECQASTLI
jgi:hypothetical protein